MIGVFDSGIGGLTIVKELFKTLQGYNILYFGDTARTPYGTKGKDTIVEYSIRNTEFLIKQGAKIIVIACNTASSVASEIIKEKFGVPVFEVITPAVQKAILVSKKKRIGIIGTRATINSKAYEAKINEAISDVKVYSNPCPLLVPLVEEGWINNRETRMIVKKYIFPLKTKQIDTLILACTHYPILKDIIKKKVGKNVEVVDSAVSLALLLKEFLIKNSEVEKTLLKTDNHIFFVSDITQQFQKSANMILKRQVNLILGNNKI